MHWILVLITIYVLCPFHNVDCGKVLVFPVDGSHWVNMKVIVEALHSRGHQVTVVRAMDSWYIKETSKFYTSITINRTSGFDEDFINSFISSLMEIQKGGKSMWARIKVELEQAQKGSEFNVIACEMLEYIFQNTELVKSLHEGKYDVFLTDPAFAVGVIVGNYLKLPLVFNVRWTTHGEGHFAIAPSPLSYVPMPAIELSDKMSFIERVMNVLNYIFTECLIKVFISPYYTDLLEKYFGPDVDYFSLFQADLWLMRVDFVFEFPRPTMPNVVYMGGFQCKPAKPLPQHLEDFVQSSGEHGVILMSLGTLVSDLPRDLADDIASAFARLPQKVIWRYVGERPTTLGNNTLLVDWMPQNDLLGHPKVKVFVAHGGTNGVQEAIYHGIPLVGLPLVFDQHDNIFKMKVRGAAKAVDIYSMNEEIFYQSIQEVLHDPSYRENMQRLSRLHRDTLMKPLDLAVFWIEFVMRHKGAAHLRTESFRMPWYSYYSVDVILFLVTVTLTVVGCFTALIKCLCYKLFLRTKRKQD